MIKIKTFFKKHKFHIAIFLILLLAAFLRFYDIENRWGIGNDSARDIAIAREALKRDEIPFSGPFSSAGPFMFGPVFYWIIMTSYIVLPQFFIAPIIFTALSGLAAVILLTICGYLLNGKKMALITAILSATSPQLVIRSVTLGQQSFIPLFLSLLILMFILFWQQKKLIYAFVMGIALALALGLHYQVINMLIFFPALLFVPKVSFKKRIIAVLVMFIGFIIPNIPSIIWDSQQNFANFNNVLDYLLIGQYRLYVPNSWKLFVFQYLPNYWSIVTAGFMLYAGMVVMFFTFGSLIFYTLKRQISGIIFILGAIFSILLFINRYYRGERSEGYLVYLLPFILLFSAWAIYKMFEINHSKLLSKIGSVIGILILLLILSTNYISATRYIGGDRSLKDLSTVIEKLEQKYPEKKFKIYDYKSRWTYQSQPLALFLSYENKIDDRGVPIGVTCASGSCYCVDSKCKVKITKVTDYNNQIVADLRIIKNLDSSEWDSISEKDMYDDLIGWAKKHQLKSTFSLKNYILERLHLR